MVNKKKIMIIEDQALLNNMLKNTLSNDYDVVSTCTSAKDMMNLYKKYKPDLILTDVVTKEGANGIEYAKEVKDKYHNKVKILAITGVPEITFLNTAKEYNLDGLIYKDTDSESLLFSISQVLKGYTLFPDNCMYSEESEKFKELSDKEIKIIRCICEAKDRDEIAEELNITSGTLKNYISNILTKLEFDNITKLTIFCLSNGYIVPNQK